MLIELYNACRERIELAMELIMLSGLKNHTIKVMLVGAAVVAWPATAFVQQEQPAGAGPGLKRSVEELKRAAAAVRAGRILTPKAWPNGARVAVCVSFDIDNESPLLARDLNPLPTALSETEYGATEGLPRILAVLDRERVPASFYLPAVSAALAPDMIPAIQKSGRHEIALHGWIAFRLQLLPLVWRNRLITVDDTHVSDLLNPKHVVVDREAVMALCRWNLRLGGLADTSDALWNTGNSTLDRIQT